MNVIAHHSIFVIVLVVMTTGMFLFGAITAIVEGWMDTRKRPREEMNLCSTHGPIRKKHMIPLFPGMVKRNGEPFTICPRCISDAWNNAEEVKK
jgi:hypothetical protein